jgi:drug/metabolite transporter (DMT)-like permease
VSSPIVAAGTAVVAAGLLGASSVAQRRGMLSPPSRATATRRRGLLATVTTSRWWWVGTVASVGGLALQFLALTLGPLVVVQTTMVSSIAATTLAERLLLGRRPGAHGWAGMALTATGLVGVLWALAPTTTIPTVPSGTVTLVLGGVGLLGILLAALRARSGPGGALALATATGLGYGITAVALKTVGAELADGWSAALTHPALWLAAVLGPAAVLLSQHALQRASRVASVVSLIVVLDPVVGLLAGTAWFGEHITTGTNALAVAVAAAAAVIVGIVLSQSRPAPVPDHLDELVSAGGNDAREAPDAHSDPDHRQPHRRSRVAQPAHRQLGRRSSDTSRRPSSATAPGRSRRALRLSVHPVQRTSNRSQTMRRSAKPSRPSSFSKVRIMFSGPHM